MVYVNYEQGVGRFEDAESGSLDEVPLAVNVHLSGLGALPLALGATSQLVARVVPGRHELVAVFWRAMHLVDVRLYVAALQRIRKFALENRIQFNQQPT